MKTGRLGWGVLPAVVLAVGCAPSAYLRISHVGRCKLSLPPKVKTIAVVGAGQKGAMDKQYAQILADELAARLGASARFELVDRENLKATLREQQLAAAGITDEATAARAGKILNASAMVYGHVHATYQQRTEMVKEARFTGNRNNPITFVTVPKLVEMGTVSANFKFVDTETGKVYLTTKADGSYNSRKDKGRIHMPGSSRTRKVKGKGEILQALTKLCADQFMQKVFHINEREVKLKGSETKANNEGVKQVKAGHYESALESFCTAVEIKPGDHEAWYNKGAVHEVMGQSRQAYDAYLKAAGINSEDGRYQTAVVRMRRAMKKAGGAP